MISQTSAEVSRLIRSGLALSIVDKFRDELDAMVKYDALHDSLQREGNQLFEIADQLRGMNIDWQPFANANLKLAQHFPDFAVPGFIRVDGSFRRHSSWHQAGWELIRNQTYYLLLTSQDETAKLVEVTKCSTQEETLNAQIVRSWVEHEVAMLTDKCLENETVMLTDNGLKNLDYWSLGDVPRTILDAMYNERITGPESGKSQTKIVRLFHPTNGQQDYSKEWAMLKTKGWIQTNGENRGPASRTWLAENAVSLLENEFREVKG